MGRGPKIALAIAHPSTGNSFSNGSSGVPVREAVLTLPNHLSEGFRAT